MKKYLSKVGSNATLLGGFLVKVLQKYSLKLLHFRLSRIGGRKGIKKMEHARRISKRQDDDWKCKTFSCVLSSKQPAGFSIIPSLQWLLEKKVTCCIVTSINWCAYLPCIGMTMKSCFNKLVLDRYLAVNFSGCLESWVQNAHGKSSRFWFGGGCWARHWWKKSLFDSGAQSMITWRK